MKEDYIQKINELSIKCNDLQMLDLIVQLLQKCQEA